MWPSLIVVYTPSLQLFGCIRKRQELVGVQACRSEPAIECFDERIVRRLAGAREAQGDAALKGPEVHVTRDELTALIDPGCLGVAGSTAYPIQCRNHVLAAIAEPRIKHRHIAREGVDDGQNPQRLARRQLVMDEVHRPDIIRADGPRAVIAQFRFYPPLRGLVPEFHPQLPANTIDFLDVDAPTLTIQKHMDAPIAIAHPELTDLLDPFLDCGLIGAAGLGMRVTTPLLPR